MIKFGKMTSEEQLGQDRLLMELMFNRAYAGENLSYDSIVAKLGTSIEDRSYSFMVAKFIETYVTENIFRSDKPKTNNTINKLLHLIIRNTVHVRFLMVNSETIQVTVYENNHIGPFKPVTVNAGMKLKYDNIKKFTFVREGDAMLLFKSHLPYRFRLDILIDYTVLDDSVKNNYSILNKNMVYSYDECTLNTVRETITNAVTKELGGCNNLIKVNKINCLTNIAFDSSESRRTMVTDMNNLAEIIVNDNCHTMKSITVSETIKL